MFFNAVINENGTITIETDSQNRWYCWTDGNIILGMNFGEGNVTIPVRASQYEEYFHGKVYFRYAANAEPVTVSYPDNIYESQYKNPNYLSIGNDIVYISNHEPTGIVVVNMGDDEGEFNYSFDQDIINVTENDSVLTIIPVGFPTDSFTTTVTVENDYDAHACFEVVYTYDYDYNVTNEKDTIIDYDSHHH